MLKDFLYYVLKSSIFILACFCNLKTFIFTFFAFEKLQVFYKSKIRKKNFASNLS